ncbi:helix-turn-helix domain-containing protein [Pediococcus inopinatus]|uniref:Helix-turn-helix domain-containing protein n=1 Tax=Pediococcus inopinatus TaxID=114090 RepID=A0ABZ0Q1R6_9LACO|nr:helix-turn-helix transcriptional regulator [Pediococcus inopinatus]WPC20890.1 helix-turn-helix domain-containing protein [Pediococcus inopinatus]
MTLFDRVKKLADAQGKSLKNIALELGFGENSLYGWKTKNPGIDKLQAVADYFGVSTDYLLGRTDNPYPAKHSKLDTLAAHAADRNHEFTDTEIDQMEAYLDGLIDSYKAKHKDDADD